MDVPCTISKKINPSEIEDKIDYILAIKWRFMIGQNELDLLGARLIVFHASLLPKYRGFAPVQWPLLNGEKQSGVTMFFAADEVDSGDIIGQKSFEILDSDCAADVDQKVEDTLVKLIEEQAPSLAGDNLKPIPQNHSEATYAIWLNEADGHLDWSQSAKQNLNRVRAFGYPYSGAYAIYNGEKIIIEKAEVVKAARTYVGRIVGKVESFEPDGAVNVLCGEGILRILQLRGEQNELVSPRQIIKNLKSRLT